MAVRWETASDYPEGKMTWEIKYFTGFLMMKGDARVLSAPFMISVNENWLAEVTKKLNEDLERRIVKRTEQLNEKIAQLEEINRVFVGREIKMVELKGTDRRTRKEISWLAIPIRQCMTGDAIETYLC